MLETAGDARSRLSIYACQTHSWFSKATLQFAFAKFIAKGGSNKPSPEVSFGRSAVVVGCD